MKKPKNCWEIKKCGREPGGSKAEELGVCPASVNVASDGTNRGRNAGRFCWAIAGTLCEGKIQGIFALKVETCLKCEVFKKVAAEEDDDFILHELESEPTETPD